MSTARLAALDAVDPDLAPAAPARARPRVRPVALLTEGDLVAAGLCALYGLALLAFHRALHDFSLRVYDFLWSDWILAPRMRSYLA